MKRAFSTSAAVMAAMLMAHGCSSDGSSDAQTDASVAVEAGSSSSGASSSGNIATDGSVAPGDATDGSVSPGDAGDTDANSHDAAAQEDAGDACEPITLQSFASDEGTFFARVQPAIVAGNNYLDIDLVRGGDVTGSHALGSGANDSLATCTQCVRLRAGAGSVGATLFVPSAGTLEIRQVDLDEESIDASLRSVILREVGNDGTTPVPEGRCLSLAGAEVRVP